MSSSEGDFRHERLAVALAYQPEGNAAPRVTAKGRGAIAERILEIAASEAIEVRRDADLAALLEGIEVMQEIPVEAFAAVAEILAYVYRIQGRIGLEQG